MFKRFFANKTGNVAMMFGLFLIPMLVGAGVAIDMLRANQVRGELTDAADAGLLAAARAKTLDPSVTDEQAKAIARQYFDANYKHSGGITIDVFDFISDADDVSFELLVQGTIKTTLMAVVGQDYSPVDILSKAKKGAGRPLEIMMVLDNTGSMGGQKISDLKDAAELLVDTIMADTDNTTLVGLVPFSTHVNMGMARGSESWLDVPADSSYDDTTCTVDEPAATSAGCSSQSSTCYSDGMPYSCTQWQCPGDADAPTSCTTTSQGQSWGGCVGSRDHPLNIQDSDFVTDLVPGVLNHTGTKDCPGEVLPMTAEKQDVLDEITAMAANGNTYIPGGLTWGLRLISSTEPFTEGKTYSDMAGQSGVKAIVLMTDGENTKSPSSYGAHYDTDVELADDYTIELCDEIKDEDIVLYTVAFDITDTDTLDMISDCATDSSTYFNADNAQDLSDAFEAIGASLTELALTQ